MWNPIVEKTEIWPRAIILVDMNAFFASVEQKDCPEWRGQPVGVTNGAQGTCIITCSYEARAYGVETGMRLVEARQLCPNLIQAASRPHRYVEISTAIMESLTAVTPDIEIFSIDEAFLDVTHCQQLHGTPEKMGRMAQKIIFETSGLLCSIGISGDKTTAKYAAKLKKPNGFNVIPPWEAKERLRFVKVSELCGIGKGTAAFLAKYGVYTCGDIEKIPISLLAKRFGNIGRRIWYMCQGADPDLLHTEIADPKSMGHGKVMPPNTKDKNIIDTYLMHMCEKLAARLRHYEFRAQTFSIGLKRQDREGWLGATGKLMQPTDDGRDIYTLGHAIFDMAWHGEPVCQIQVTATDPRHNMTQLDLFCELDFKRQNINRVLDQINSRYGEFTIAPLAMIDRSPMPNVIAPAWKPAGHRQTI
jgi:DNA polymerase IV